MTRDNLEQIARSIRSRLSDSELLQIIDSLDLDGLLDFVAKRRLKSSLLSGSLPKCNDATLLSELGHAINKLSSSISGERNTLVGAYLGLLYLSFALCESRMDIGLTPNAFRLLVAASNEWPKGGCPSLSDTLQGLAKNNCDEAVYFSVLSSLLIADAFDNRMQSDVSRLDPLKGLERTFEEDELAQWRKLANSVTSRTIDQHLKDLLTSRFSWLVEEN